MSSQLNALRKKIAENRGEEGEGLEKGGVSPSSLWEKKTIINGLHASSQDRGKGVTGEKEEGDSDGAAEGGGRHGQKEGEKKFWEEGRQSPDLQKKGLHKVWGNRVPVYGRRKIENGGKTDTGERGFQLLHNTGKLGLMKGKR